MKRTALRNRLLTIALAVLLATIAWLPTSALAGQKKNTLPAHYPKKFTFTGCIQRATADDMVISDGLFKFAPDVTFNTPKALNTSRSWFRVGRRVGVIMNARHQIESLWYLGKKCH